MLVEKSNYSVCRMARLLEVSRSGFYAWCKRAPSQRAVRTERIEQKVIWFHGESDEVSVALTLFGGHLVREDVRYGNSASGVCS